MRGLCGEYLGTNYGNCILNNCVNWANIEGDNSGGLCGSLCGAGPFDQDNLVQSGVSQTTWKCSINKLCKSR